MVPQILSLPTADSDNVGVLLGNGDGTFELEMTLWTGSKSGPSSIIVGDYNDDGHLDLAVANMYSDNIVVLFGNNDGTFEAQTTFCADICESLTSFAAGDFNGDGRLESCRHR